MQFFFELFQLHFHLLETNVPVEIWGVSSKIQIERRDGTGRLVLGAPDFLPGDTMSARAKNKQKPDAHGASEKIHERLTAIENRFVSENGKPTVKDYGRLLELERELDDNEPRRDRWPTRARIGWTLSTRPV